MFEPGTQVGRYEIQRRLGRGGMGTVYVAHDPVLGRMVAIKVFAGDLDMPDARERFAREARAAAALNHPNIVTVYDFGEYASQPYIVMEYVAGETLANIIRRKVSVALADKLRWMEDLCAGVGYAHQMSVVHRDIKPANLIVDRSGRLKILDFGIARMLGIASNTAVMIGTPGYMAPEQITGDVVDHRSDQFSIGVVFYEVLAYAEPFPGDTMPQITHRVVSQEPTPLEQLVPDLSPDIVAIVTQALKKNSAHRFKDTETMRLAISRVRRKLDSDGDWTVTATAIGRATPAPSGGSRGTGSERRRTDESIGVAQLTPPPDPRRTDRELLARRRTAQVQAALTLAKTFLEQGDLDAALDSCHQALTLDESHEAALELEAKIQAAIRARDGVEPAAEATLDAEGPTLVDAGSARSPLLDSQAATRHPSDAFRVSVSHPVEKRPTNPPVPPAAGLSDEKTAIRIPAASAASVPPPGKRPTSPPVPPAAGLLDEETAIRIPAAPAEPTIIAPPRRTPAPAASRAAAAPGPAAAAAQAHASAGSSRASARAVKAPPQKAERANPLAPALRAASSAWQSIGPALGGVSEALRGSMSRAGLQRSIAFWAAAIVGVLAVTGGIAFVLTRGPAPTGTIVVDAVPWATITAVRNERGEEQPLTATPATTPLALTLPVGTYQITLTGPPPASTSDTITVRVDVGATSVAPVARFQSMTPEEYFEQYIGAGDAPGASPVAAIADAEGEQ